MSNTPVILGDASSLMKHAPFKIKSNSEISQKEADILGHFVHVVSLLQKSNWFNSKSSYSYQGGLTKASLPNHESMAVALLYVRQLIEDGLFRESIKIFLEHLDNNLAAAWISAQLDSWKKSLDSKNGRYSDLSNKEVLKTWYYGYSVFHRVHGKHTQNEQYRKALFNILDYPYTAETNAEFDLKRVQYVFEVDEIIRCSIINRISSTAVVMNYTLGHWQSEGKFPAPDIIFHGSLNEGFGHEEQSRQNNSQAKG